LSYTIFAQFLWFVGLNLINPVHAENDIQIGQLFAGKLSGAPSGEFYDIVKADGSLWLAGHDFGKLHVGEWRVLLDEGSYTALAHDPVRHRLWYAGPAGIGSLAMDTEEMGAVTEAGVGYIWKLVLMGEDLWYFGTKGYGVLDVESGELGEVFAETFSPRPFVLWSDHDKACIYVSAAEGLYRVEREGRHLILPVSSTGGNPVAFMFPNEERYVIGTVDNLYTWSGEAGSAPQIIERGQASYSDFFRNGMNNAVLFPDHIAVTDVPRGVLLLNRSTLVPEAYVGSGGGLDVGNVYKIAKGGDNELLVMGEEGVAVCLLDSPHVFYPSGREWSSETVRLAGHVGESTLLVSEGAWIQIEDNLLKRRDLVGMAYWLDEEPDGDPVLGYLNAYKWLHEGEWKLKELDVPVHDLKWGEEKAYVSGPEGLFVMTEELIPRLIYETESSLHLLGELASAFYAVEGSARLLRFEWMANRWVQQEGDLVLDNPVSHVTVATDRIYFVSGNHLFSVDDEGRVTELPIQAGWDIIGICSLGSELIAAFQHVSSRMQAVGVYGESDPEMLDIRELGIIGDILNLVGGAGKLGILTSEGYADFELGAITRQTKPVLEIDLLLDDKRLQDRTLPYGMHEIKVAHFLRGPDIATEIQYRINKANWNTLNPLNPMLSLGGSGPFEVEVRAVYPNGTASETQSVRFAIRPPWYLNPLYQTCILILFLIMVVGVYYLRHAQLKRTNQWLQEEVRKQTLELEAATAARTNFLAGLSHDIRNPLNGVLMIAETLTRDPPKSGDDSRLKDLTEFGVIVDRMLGEILDFSAIDQSNMPMAFMPVSISEILESSVQQNQFSIRKSLINVSISIPAELKEISIKADRNWMVKILTNLIVNALEYSGSERIEVGAYCHRLTPADVEMEIYVKDWGAGIDDTEKQFVFDRFYRGETGIESGKHGTGLGLAICQEIAHAMGAHLSLHDNTPSGCHFSLKGRFERVSAVGEMNREAVLASLRGKRILVVDDLRYNRRSIVDFFQAIGCDCDESENGREALEMLAGKRYDMALLDWDLPGIIGPEIARRHRLDHPDDPVVLIALTAYTDGEKKRQSEAVGMNGYISKPLTANRLANCLANLGDEPEAPSSPQDVADSSELDEEIIRHVRDCLHFGEAAEWENLRRCAHRLTTLALLKDNNGMQKVCRDLQVAAKEENFKEVQVGLTELQQWKRL